MTESIRLAKKLIALIGCSRREAELLITAGNVTVDGVIIEEPQFMVGDEHVELQAGAQPLPLPPITLIAHQISGIAPQLLETSTRSSDDASEIRILKYHHRLSQFAPLEPGADGLTVYSQDWRVERKLKADAATLEQEYLVEVAGTLSAEGLKLLNHGLTYRDRALTPCKVSWQNETRLRFAIKGIVTGQIKHACETVGLQVISYKRLRIGRVAMSKLPQGQWRYLVQSERF